MVLISVLSGIQINTPEPIYGQLVGAKLKVTCLGVIFDRDLNYCQPILRFFLIPNAVHV